jgi:hypothetical protein
MTNTECDKKNCCRKKIGTFRARSISNNTYSESLEKLMEVTPISGSARIYSPRSSLDVIIILLLFHDSALHRQHFGHLATVRSNR